MLFQSSAEAQAFHVKHWIRQSGEPFVSVCRLQASNGSCLWHLIVVAGPASVCAARLRTLLHFDNFIYVCLYPPEPQHLCSIETSVGRPQLSRGPSLQFAIVCHHLFILTNKTLALCPLLFGPGTHGISCSPLLMTPLQRYPFCIPPSNSRLAMLASWARTCAGNSSPRLITSFRLALILQHVAAALLMVCLSRCMRR